MTAKELRKKYLEFFKSKGHKVVPSASLVPENDPTVLFTTAGMHPLVPYLLGEIHPEGKRLVSVQKCLRTDDIDEVGDETHNTFFEMLGNWSLGDYWKKEAISWSYEFLTNKKWLGLEPSKLAVSAFAGDKDAPRDGESVEIWKSLGISEERIAYLPKKDNWWGPAGITGPCGPDTEMFYWTGKGGAPHKFNASDKRWVEIWNDVFMEYSKTIDGKFEPLKQKNVDTGMGLERTLAALQGKASVFDTELFTPIIEKVRELARSSPALSPVVEPTGSQRGFAASPPRAGGEKSERIVADHLRAATFVIADGATPSNKDRGYILRRLIRRAIRHGQLLGINREFCTEVAAVVIEEYAPVYPELKHHAEKIIDELGKEDLRFRKTLEKGLKEFERITRSKHFDLSRPAGPLPTPGEGGISGKDAFDLFQTYGFPLELTEELAAEWGIKIDKEQFEAEFKKHQELSRTATAGKFKGGLADHTEEVIQLHTSTHLLQAALRKVLGGSVYQKGSNITKERTRFDFTHPQKMVPNEIKKVEELVNGWIKRDLSVKREMMPLEEARKLGAIGLFGEKYGETVSIYTVYNQMTNEVISREFCGGPHVEHTGAIKGTFKIVKEEAAAAGIRRVKGVLD